MNKGTKGLMKHLVLLCAILCLSLQGKMSVMAATASTLSVSGYGTVSTLTEGQAFIVKGTVSSNYKITKVTASIATSGGTVKYTKSATPNATSYSLSGLDSAMRFDLLAPGSYVFKVDATDASGLSKNLLKQSFTVVSNLKVTGYNALSSLKQGQAFIVKGTVSSSYKITKVTAYISTSSGTVKYTKSATPNATSYSLSGLDSAMRFDLLTVGSYVFKVDAADSSGTSKNILKQNFTVTSTQTNVTVGVTNWLNNCKSALQYYANNGFSYGTASPSYIATKTTNKKTNCAAYVSWCLYRNGFVSNESATNQCAQGTACYVYQMGWTMNTDPNNIKAGDVVYYSQTSLTSAGKTSAINWLKSHNPSSASPGMHVDISYDPANRKFLSAGDDAYIKTGNIATHSTTYMSNNFVCSFRYPN